MPDLATHVLATHLVSRIRLPWRALCVPLLLGAILPDVLTRPLYMLFPKWFWFFFPLHSPFVLVFVCYILSFLFEERLRVKAFVAMYVGVLFHIGLDLLQKSVAQAYAPLFPFSWISWSAGLFWPDESLLLLPVLLIIILGIALRRLILDRRRSP
jgi:hypothetical protein